eukprot:947894-Pelagomonas_calceolata.AAC.1
MRTNCHTAERQRQLFKVTLPAGSCGAGAVLGCPDLSHMRRLIPAIAGSCWPHQAASAAP